VRARAARHGGYPVDGPQEALRSADLDTARAAGAKIREVVGLCSGPNQNSLHVSSDLIRTRAVRVQALGALKQNGRALHFASAELKANREVVMAAVEQSGTALRFAAAELKADHEVVMAAVEQSGGPTKQAASTHPRPTHPRCTTPYDCSSSRHSSGSPTCTSTSVCTKTSSHRICSSTRRGGPQDEVQAWWAAGFTRRNLIAGGS
jgi:hypothetical protein